MASSFLTCKGGFGGAGQAQYLGLNKNVYITKGYKAQLHPIFAIVILNKRFKCYFNNNFYFVQAIFGFSQWVRYWYLPHLN